MIYIPISPGELFDKITILQIKRERVKDQAKLRNVNCELELLEKIRDDGLPPTPELCQLVAGLKELNEQLWDVEDRIRDCEHQFDFGDHFIELARSVYHLNHQRAKFKRQINLLLGSELVEEKAYSQAFFRSPK